MAKKNYHTIVMQVINNADIIAEVVDARFPEQSRNEWLEKTVLEKGKKLLIVINKADLVSEAKVLKSKETLGVTSVFVSAKQKKGGIKLREVLGKLSKKEATRVAFVGYPNTGKSSVINMLKGKKSASTSPTAGFTKGKQQIRISSKVMLVDTPGIIPIDEKDETLMVLLSSLNVQQVKDLESTGINVAQAFLKTNRKKLGAFYGVEAKDGEEFLEKIAFKRNKLLKEGKPNTREAARLLITDFQRGKLTL